MVRQNRKAGGNGVFNKCLNTGDRRGDYKLKLTCRLGIRVCVESSFKEKHRF